MNNNALAKILAVKTMLETVAVDGKGWEKMLAATQALDDVVKEGTSDADNDQQGATV